MSQLSLDWDKFKEIVDDRNLSIQYIEFSNQYYCKLFDYPFEAECWISKDGGIPQTEFEASYKAIGNRTPKQKVITEFELEDKVLRLAKAEATYDGNGDAFVEVQVPGAFDPLNPSRLIAEAYCVTDSFYWGDNLTQVYVYDKDNILGYGPGTVLERYHDYELPEANQGWFFYPTHQNHGEIEIEPLGGFARLPGGLWLRAEFKKEALSPATKVMCVIWWGARDETQQ